MQEQTDTPRSTYVYKTTLKHTCGLSPKWIARLGEPDKIRPNPHYSRGPASKLYHRARVEALIDANLDEWRRLQASRAKRSKTMHAIADTKRAALAELVDRWVGSVELDKYLLPKQFDRLLDYVERTGYDLLHARGKFDQVFVISPNAVIAYVRHCWTTYESALSELENELERVGMCDACVRGYEQIRSQVDALVNKMLSERYGPVWKGYCDNYSNAQPAAAAIITRCKPKTSPATAAEPSSS